MPITLTPPPARHEPLDGANFARVWTSWFNQLSRLLNQGAIPWSALDMTGSDHEDIAVIQGGTSAQHYHLTAAEYSELQRANNVASVAVSTTLTDSHRTVIATASAVTLTLPAASSARIGLDWTIVQGADGYVTIVPAGSDTFLVDEGDDAIVLDEEGATLTLRCVTTTSWAIV